MSKKQRIVSSALPILMSSFISSTHVISPSAFPSGRIFIGTHDGSFHCDEALAIGMLKILPKYQPIDIIRTRNPELLKNCDIVVDVGAVYDPLTHRYDHHQREFTGVFDGFSTKLSSAGLVYKHFGKEILKTLLAEEENLTDAFFDEAYTKLYKDFMEHIDAIDNGVSVADGTIKYHVSSTLSSRVGRLNPNWNEPQTPEILNERFKSAMELTSSEFIDSAQGLARSWWPARSIVQKALDERFTVHASGKVMILPQACPWKDHLFDLEAIASTSGSGPTQEVLYALYADMGGSWRIQSVPVNPTSFDSRKKLPWCGLRDEVLSKECGIDGCIFIHASGFIGGHQTMEGAIAMAIKALDM